MADLSWSSDNSRFVEDDQVLEMSYYEKKTNSYCSMTYLGDFINWELDVLVMLAANLILVGKSDDLEDTSVKHLFPSLQSTSKEGVSRKVSKMLKDQVGHVIGLDKDVTSHDIRYGSTEDMTRVELCAIILIICRGGWAFEGECTAFRYLSQRMDIIRGGRALAGYEVPSLIAPQSSLKAIQFESTSEELKLKCLMNKLFSSLPSCKEATDRLYSAKETMFAALIENLELIDKATRWVDDDGKVQVNVLVQIVEASCLSEHLTMSDLMRWGREVSFMYILPFCGHD